MDDRLTDNPAIHAPPPALTPRAERKLAQVLAGAREVIFAHGFQAASVDDIARAAGVSKATLYRYFPDKASLFAAVMSSDCSWQCEDLIPVETEGRRLEDILTDIAHWVAGRALSEEGQSAFRAALAESERFPQLGAAFYRMVDSGRRWLAPVLAAAAERGEIETDDPDLAARRFMSLCRGDLFLRRLFCGAGAVGVTCVSNHIEDAVEAFMLMYRPRR